MKYLFGSQRSTNVPAVHAEMAERVTIKYVVTIAAVLLDMQDTYAKQVNINNVKHVKFPGHLAG